MGEDEVLPLEAAPDPRIGATFDKYRIDGKLGEGGMGAVYAGTHVLIKRRVAIKTLHAHYAQRLDIVQRFQREALAAGQIGNEHIIDVLDMGRFPDGAAYIVLELLEGRDLADLVEKEGPIPIARTVHIVSQLCDALGAAHAKGIVHRDLKPENVFLVRRGGDPDFVKVLDFGISKFQEPEGAGPGALATVTGAALGTPYYMAPEQMRNSKTVDQRADLYALGVILFHMLTGRFPFEADSFPLLMLAVMQSPRLR